MIDFLIRSLQSLKLNYLNTKKSGHSRFISIYSQSVHALALNAGLMDNDAELYGIITNHYLLEITPVNPFIIHFKDIYIYHDISFLKL